MKQPTTPPATAQSKVNGSTQWSTLAGLLGVSRQTIYNWKKQPDAPTVPEVEAWRAWIASRQPENAATLAELKAELIAEQIRGARLKNAMTEGETLPRAEVIHAAERATAIWVNVLRARLETEAPPRLIGLSIAELRAELRTITDELCSDVVKALEAEAGVG